MGKQAVVSLTVIDGQAHGTYTSTDYVGPLEAHDLFGIQKARQTVPVRMRVWLNNRSVETCILM